MQYLRRNTPIALAVALSLVVIASTYFYVQHKKSATKEDEKQGIVLSEKLDTIRGLQPDDHILGNPKAPILLFVYSDFSCPFCVDYHETIRTVMRTYGSEGNVAIVFRHMPLVQLHPEAPMYALASECVAQELGSAGFWAFADDIFKLYDPLQPLTAANLVILAENVGATRQTFVACMRANELMAEVEKEYQEGIDAGAEGSPFTIIEAGGSRAAYQGAQTYRTLGIIIQTLQRKFEVEGQASSTDFESGVNFSDEFEEIEIENEVTVPTSTSTGNNAPLPSKIPSILDAED